ncbi:MAG: tyrosine--tRNA ligase [Candidatus Paceibacterota bacterium]|jgi:tyrosyl-tRNA synthetase
MFDLTKPKIITDENKINEVLSRGVEEVINVENLKKKLKSGKQLRIKLGIDPTSPNIHIGRAIPLLKLRDFQKLGHKIVFIIGDFTGTIGDTSDKESERPMLTDDTIKKNLKDYVKQASKIIDIDKCEIHYNSEWLSKLNYKKICEQADVFSLSDFISRENIKKRLDEGRRISFRELMYPLMQGYDSVAIEADVEIGGTDQRFNLLAGRDLQRFYKQEPQDILTNPLIEGLDGRKMSSSWGNVINLFDLPNDMYGKVMSLKDELIIKYFVLTTRLEMSEIEKHKKELESGVNPRDIKMKLAREMVRMYYGEKEAEKAEENFESIFSKGEFPAGAQILIASKEVKLIDCLVDNKIIESKSEFRRLLEAGAVTDYPNQKITDVNELVGDHERKIKIGKKTFVIIKI